jgi:hypothetical protein
MFAYAFPRADYYDEAPPTARGEVAADSEDGDSDA